MKNVHERMGRFHSFCLEFVLFTSQKPYQFPNKRVCPERSDTPVAASLLCFTHLLIVKIIWLFEFIPEQKNTHRYNDTGNTGDNNCT